MILNNLTYPLLKAKNLIIGAIVLGAIACFSHAGYMQIKGIVAQYLLNSAWQKTVLINTEKTNENKSKSSYIREDKSLQIRPWYWADIYPVAKLTFTQQDKHFIVLNNDSGQALAFGPGISGKTPIGSKLPLVISAHNDSHFSLLENIKLGDEIIIKSINGQNATLRISAINIIDTRAEQMLVNELNTTGNTQGIVLVTCYPFNALSRNTPYRYIVEAS